MKPGGGRNKGAAAEREIVTMARELGFMKARRLAPMQAGYGGDYPDVDGVGPLWIEAKRYKRCSVNTFTREHVDKERPGHIPVLAWRDDGTEWRATLSLRELLKLVAKVYGGPADVIPFPKITIHTGKK